MLELPHNPVLDNPHQHINTNIDTLSIPYPMEITHPPPKPYKLRPKRVPKTLNTIKRKTHPQYPQHDNKHQLDLNKQTKSTIKHNSVAQAPPRINVAFPAPSVMPHRTPPMNVVNAQVHKHKQGKVTQTSVQCSAIW